MILAAPVAVLAAQRTYGNVGTLLSQAEIQSFDHMIGPEGKELRLASALVPQDVQGRLA